MPSKNGNGNENIAGALAEISDRLTRLVQDEIELAKAEVGQKAMSLVRGAAALAAGAVFGIFAVVFLLLTLAWVFDGIFVSGAGSLWLGFLIVLVILLVLTVAAAVFAWRSFSVGAPTPKLAISEGKKIKDTVTSFGGPVNGNGTSGSKPSPSGAPEHSSRSFAAVAAPAAGFGSAIEPSSEPAAAAPTAPTPVPAVEPQRSTPEPQQPVSALPEPSLWAPVQEPEPELEPSSPESPAEDEPTFVSVPEESPTQVHPTVPNDSPALLADQEKGATEAPAGDEPANEVEQGHEDDDSRENH